jgi:hypothetical protein
MPKDQTTAIVIERGIPLPRRMHEKYPLGAMKVGDSFVYPDRAARNGIFASAVSRGIKIATRAVDGGLRVWRIK